MTVYVLEEADRTVMGVFATLTLAQQYVVGTEWGRRRKPEGEWTGPHWFAVRGGYTIVEHKVVEAASPPA